MLIIQDKFVSLDIVEEQFLCNLNVCKGACCWEGDSGAPLEIEELKILDEIYDKVRPYLDGENIARIESKGGYKYYEDFNEYGTNLLDNGACVYITKDKLGFAKCGIEQAYRDGEIDFYKPISCHLYPIRVTEEKSTNFEALNYDKWDICSAACELGKKEQLPIYQFVKDAIVRKYGEDFYEELDAAAKVYGK
ncbi:MAG: DUF3109 family protein, partial [Bacteroidota bacterium]